MNFKRTAIAIATALTIGGLLASCGGDSDSLEVTSGTVIRNTTVVGTRDGSLRRDVNVVLDQGRVRTVTERDIAAGPGVTVIDGSGRFVVPGYLDMHTHAGSSSNDLALLLANGVTGIREAGGNAQQIQAAHDRNTAVQARTVAAPEVLMTPIGLSGANDAAARQSVRTSLAAGADYIKITAAAPEPFLAAIDEAKKQGSHAAGHLPLAVSSITASDAGYRSFEHLGAGMGVVIECSSEAATIRAQAAATPVQPPTSVTNARIFDANAHAPFMQRVIATHDDAACSALARTFVRNDTWQTVTLIRSRTMMYGADPVYVNDPNLKYVDKARLQAWNTAAGQFSSRVTPEAQAVLKAFYAHQLRVTRHFKDNGVRILAGSDLGGGWVIPGFSLHQEFRELAAAGLTPLEVLRATTLSAAEFAGRQATLGVVEEGKHADLVLLDANPLADVANLDRIAGVFLRGRYFPRAELDKLLAAVATANALQSSQQAALELRRQEELHPPHN